MPILITQLLYKDDHHSTSLKLSPFALTSHPVSRFPQLILDMT